MTDIHHMEMLLFFTFLKQHLDELMDCAVMFMMDCTFSDHLG